MDELTQKLLLAINDEIQETQKGLSARAFLLNLFENKDPDDRRARALEHLKKIKKLNANLKILKACEQAAKRQL